jgi:predicted dehydrogenase
MKGVSAMSKLTRRAFGRAIAGAGLAAAISSRSVRGADDRIQLGFIGLGNRGDQVLDGFLAHSDAQVTAICDLHEPYLAFAAKKVGGNPRRFTDYRRLLELKDLNAVVISTPDHWHALQTIHACQAGKDVYVEKPLSLCVQEGRRMVEVARKFGRIVQVGLQRRSTPFCREAAELVRSGALGKVTFVRSFHIQNEWPRGIGNPPDESPPAGFDWDAWLGPAPKLPYNRNRAFYRFRWFLDYSGGQLTNFGTHYMDFTHWALGVDTPIAVTAMGGKLAVEDNREVPDTLEVLWTYPGGILVSFTQINTNAAPADRHHSNLEIRGTKGTLYLTWNGYEVVPEVLTDREFPALTPLDRTLSRQYREGRKAAIEPKRGKGSDGTADHARNFLDCVRSRATPNCDIETGHRSNVPSLIGLIAHRMKAYLEWDSISERFTNHPAANRLLSYAYRDPYRLPEI